jgi:2-succinyl-5-enolpyruvyl-6-hydroxy-3-cyclohexene-1-carboxylate synthase
VLNNGGGRIFARMFRDRAMQSAHALSFRPWADLWGLPYERWEEIPPDVAGSPGPRVVEIVPDGAATARFWSGYDALAVEQAGEGA